MSHLERPSRPPTQSPDHCSFPFPSAPDPQRALIKWVGHSATRRLATMTAIDRGDVRTDAVCDRLGTPPALRAGLGLRGLRPGQPVVRRKARSTNS